MSSKSSRISSDGRKGAWLLAGALAGALSAHGAATAVSVLDDFEAGSNQNKFQGYSYFYADGADNGTSQVLSSIAGPGKNELLVDPAKSFDAGNGSSKALLLDFKYGATQPVACGGTCPYGQMVGFGTQLIAGTDPIGGATAGKTLDMTGATAITFSAKASVLMKVRVEITTTDVTDYGFHRGEVTVNTTWGDQVVMLTPGLGGINQPPWALAVPFNAAKVQKLQFQISADDNPTLTEGKLWLDDIKVSGFNWVPPSACIPCVTAQAPVTGAVLSNLEPDAATTPARPGNQNAAGGFWFVYNDVGSRTVATQADYSEIFGGVDLTDPLAPLFQVSADKGAAGSAGAYIQFTLGPSYVETPGTAPIMPFVGLGTKTSDALETTSWNATGSTGIAFDYKTSATSTFKFVRLEVKTKQTDLGTNPGVVHSVQVPATNGAWMTANIPWNKFSLPDWDEVPNKLAPVQTSSIVKLQWAVQDAPGATGDLAIDNVVVPGLTGFTAGIRPAAHKSVRGLKMHNAAGRLNVSFDLPAGVRDAKVSLVDMKGAVVASRSLEGNQASLDTRNLRSGVYSLKVSYGDVVRSAAVTLLQ